MMLRAYFLLKQLSLNAFSAKILIVSSTGMFVKKDEILNDTKMS